MKKISIADLRKKKNFTTQQKPRSERKKRLRREFSHLEKRDLSPVTESIMQYIDNFRIPNGRSDLGSLDFDAKCKDMNFGFVDTRKQGSDDCDGFLENDVLFNNPYSLSHMMKKMDVDKFQYNSFFPNSKVVVVKKEDDYEFIRKKQNMIYAKEILTEGVSFLSKERFKKASEVFTRSLDFDAENPETYYHRGLAYMKLNKWKKAYDDFEKVMKLQPDHQEAKKHYEETSERIKKFELQATKIGDPFEKDFQISAELLPKRYRKEKTPPRRASTQITNQSSSGRNSNPSNTLNRDSRNLKRKRSMDIDVAGQQLAPSQKRRKKDVGEERIRSIDVSKDKPTRKRSPVRRNIKTATSHVSRERSREPTAKFDPLQPLSSVVLPQQQSIPNRIGGQPPASMLVRKPPPSVIGGNNSDYGTRGRSSGGLGMNKPNNISQPRQRLYQPTTASYSPSPLLNLHGRPGHTPAPPQAVPPVSLAPPLQPLRSLPPLGNLQVNNVKQPVHQHQHQRALVRPRQANHPQRSQPPRNVAYRPTGGGNMDQQRGQPSRPSQSYAPSSIPKNVPPPVHDGSRYPMPTSGTKGRSSRMIDPRSVEKKRTDVIPQQIPKQGVGPPPVARSQSVRSEANYSRQERGYNSDRKRNVQGGNLGDRSRRSAKNDLTPILRRNQRDDRKRSPPRSRGGGGGETYFTPERDGGSRYSPNRYDGQKRHYRRSPERRKTKYDSPPRRRNHDFTPSPRRYSPDRRFTPPKDGGRRNRNDRSSGSSGSNSRDSRRRGRDSRDRRRDLERRFQPSTPPRKRTRPKTPPRRNREGDSGKRRR